MAAALAIVVGSGPAAADDATKRAPSHPKAAALARPAVQVETITFPGRNLASVRLLRGVPGAARRIAPPPLRSEIVSFGPDAANRVTIVRGGPPARSGPSPAHTGRAPETAPPARIEQVSFSDKDLPAVTVIRGFAEPVRFAPPDTFAIDLFAPANGDELDRIAFAVDGIESRHGADLRMWRPDANGPQGPMQVSAAAATDVGGGDRFDLQQNRQLGQAYLAQMFRRYGNWADALRAYNWGPGNLDAWIAGGRNPDRLPPGVAYYVSRVLRDALLPTAAAALDRPDRR